MISPIQALDDNFKSSKLTIMKKTISQIKEVAQKLIDKKDLKSLKGGDTNNIIIGDYLGS